MSDTYSMASVVGKQLLAKRKVPILDSPYDDAKVLGYYTKGQTIGVVDTYFAAKSGNGRKRDNNYWGFTDHKQAPFYCKHAEGWYDISAALAQGLQSEQDKLRAEKEAAEKEANPFEFYLKKYGSKVLLFVGALVILTTVLPLLFRKK